jgi:hypothetical protein
MVVLVLVVLVLLLQRLLVVGLLLALVGFTGGFFGVSASEANVSSCGGVAQVDGYRSVSLRAI